MSIYTKTETEGGIFQLDYHPFIAPVLLICMGKNWTESFLLHNI